MSIASRAGDHARAVARLAGTGLRGLAFLIVLVVAMFLPVPILGRPQFERPERRNRVAETQRRR